MSEGGLGLERCVRLMPHDQDTGGFFIAILEKVGEHPAEAGLLPEDTPEVCVTEGSTVMPEELSTKYDADAAAGAGRKRKGEGGGGGGGGGGGSGSAGGASSASSSRSGLALRPNDPEFREMWNESMAKMTTLHANGGCSEDAVMAAASNGSYAPLFIPEPSMVDALVAAYGLDAAFPSKRLIVRSPTAKSLLLVSDEVLALLRADAATGRLRVVNTGVHVLERETAKGAGCAYRLCQDGLPHILPHVSKQRVTCSKAAAVRLLTCKQSISGEELQTSDDLSPLATTLRTSCAAGSVVVCCDTTEAVSFVALYSGSGSLGPMVKPLERQALLFRLGVDPHPPDGGRAGGGEIDSKDETGGEADED